jgi:hypothetical protein
MAFSRHLDLTWLFRIRLTPKRGALTQNEQDRIEPITKATEVRPKPQQKAKARSKRSSPDMP